MREFWRKQPKWLWAIAAGAIMIEAGSAVIAASRRGQRAEAPHEQAKEV